MLDDKRAFLETAFPGQTFEDDQVKAFSEFVKMCVEDGYEDEEEELDEEGGKKGPGADIALILGEPKKGGK